MELKTNKKYNILNYKMDDCFVIRKQKLAGFLMMNGFVLKGLEPNYDESGRNVFLFKNSNALQDMIEQYKTLYCSVA